MPEVNFVFKLGDQVSVQPMGGMKGVICGLRCEENEGELSYKYDVRFGETQMNFGAEEIEPASV